MCGVCQNVTCPVYYNFKKIFPYKIFFNYALFLSYSHFFEVPKLTCSNMVSHHWRLQMTWKHHQWMPVTWYICKRHPTCHTKCQDWPVILASKVGLRGQVESWQGYSCQKWMKFLAHAANTIVNWITHIVSVSGTILSSKTPGWYLEDRLSLDWVNLGQNGWNFQHRLQIHL